MSVYNGERKIVIIWFAPNLIKSLLYHCSQWKAIFLTKLVTHWIRQTKVTQTQVLISTQDPGAASWVVGSHSNAICTLQRGKQMLTVHFKECWVVTEASPSNLLVDKANAIGKLIPEKSKPKIFKTPHLLCLYTSRHFPDCGSKWLGPCADHVLAIWQPVESCWFKLCSTIWPAWVLDAACSLLFAMLNKHSTLYHFLESHQQRVAFCWPQTGRWPGLSSW